MPETVTEKVWTIVVAGGSSLRFGSAKQFEQLGSVRVLDLSVSVAREASDGVIVVVPADHVDAEGVDGVEGVEGVEAVCGGSTRSESVRNGLAAVPADATIICVHDAARPFASRLLYAAVIEAVATGAACAIPGIEVTDTIKVISPNSQVVSTPDRASLRAVQTPQAFRASVLRAAHAAAAEGTDDAALVEALGVSIIVVPGHADNRKITYPHDLEWARAQVGRS